MRRRTAINRHKMKNILIITGRYLPGYKDGGPVRTIKNLTDLLGDEYHFTIMCADRDHGDLKPYDGIKEGINTVGKADVVYVKDGDFSFSDIKKYAAQSDLVYVCGPYNSYALKALVLNKFGLVKGPFVLAPMGSFSKGALSIKSTKKKIFFVIVRILGLFRNVYFSVTSDVEEKELQDALHMNNKCFIARDPQRMIDEKVCHDGFRKDGKLQVVFISRISEKKNLSGAIDILSRVSGAVNFSIYGNIEDKEYYEKCLQKLNVLPDNISYEYKGIAASEDVPKILSDYDVFLFPTHGENFGHVISEALMAGTIPVISDTTPWLDFDDKHAGFVVKHDSIDSFVRIIDSLCSMEDSGLAELSDNAVSYYRENYAESIKNNGYRVMYEELLR